MDRQSNLLNRRSFLAASAAAAGASFWGARAAEEPSFEPKRVVLVTLDTLRRDHLPFYGYPRNTAPFLNEMASRAVVFKEAICGCSNTTPAHMTLFTSLHLPQHHMYYNAHASATEGLYCMADMYRDLGYETAGFASVIWMRLFSQGFDAYRSYAERYVQPGAERVFYQPAETTISQALEWLEGHGPNDRFFLWVHLYDIHDPYYPPGDMADAIYDDYGRNKDALYRHWTRQQHKQVGAWAFAHDRGEMVGAQNLYDAEIRYADRELARLYQAMSHMGLNDESLWVVTSDHGEGLGGHYYFGHGMRIYQEQLSCPLLIHTPGGQYAAGFHDGSVHHVDLLPTLAAIHGGNLGAQPMRIQGRSILPALLRPEEALSPCDLYAQRRLRVEDTASAHWDPDPVFALYRDRYVHIHRAEGTDALYDLASDPYQIRNLIDEDVPGKDGLVRSAREKFAELTEDGTKLKQTGFTDQYRETLDALGYL